MSLTSLAPWPMMSLWGLPRPGRERMPPALEPPSWSWSWSGPSPAGSAVEWSDDPSSWSRGLAVVVGAVVVVVVVDEVASCSLAANPTDWTSSWPRRRLARSNRSLMIGVDLLPPSACEWREPTALGGLFQLAAKLGWNQARAYLVTNLLLSRSLVERERERGTTRATAAPRGRLFGSL